MSHSKKRRAKERRDQAKHQSIELRVNEARAIVERTKSALSAEDHSALNAIVETLAFVTAELKSKKTSLERLRKMLFGAPTEKTRKVLGDDDEKSEGPPQDPSGESGAKRKGHGRNGAAAFTGAKRIKVPHPTLHIGDCCPECLKGHVYELPEPGTLVRITGMAPLGAEVYSRDRLRCNLCLEVFTAPVPEGVGDKKYDETATATVGLLKYGTGLPFNRVEKLQAGFGVPMPAATQWELVKDGAEALAPAHEELTRQAAQGQVLHNDDTTMKVLELTPEQRAAAAADDEPQERTGVFTSGIVSTREGQRIALFLTGAKHAGENLADVLAKRAAELEPPIQMCDALSRNTTGDFETLVANCIAHARRKYVDVAEDFPAECRHVLETLREVYKNDAVARQRSMTPEERLQLHQAQSGPSMAGLHDWMNEQFAERKVEPNSGLGQAIRYMQKHWSKLTLFLRAAGAPLDNNLCERTLKRAILHRKNSLFYKTLAGARVGDIFMSLIHTAELNDVQPFEYLVALLRHPEQVEGAPAGWMPWNYRETLSALEVKPAVPPTS